MVRRTGGIERNMHTFLPTLFRLVRCVIPGSDTPSASPRADTTSPPMLTAQQRRVLPLLAKGWTNREIAEELCISPNTVKKHLRELNARLGTHNRGEAVRIARDYDLLVDDGATG